MKEVKIRIGRMGVRFLKEGKEWILSDLLYVNDLVLYGELEEDLKAMVGWFFEVSKRRGLNVNGGVWVCISSSLVEYSNLHQKQS